MKLTINGNEPFVQVGSDLRSSTGLVDVNAGGGSSCSGGSCGRRRRRGCGVVHAVVVDMRAVVILILVVLVVAARVVHGRQIRSARYYSISLETKQTKKSKTETK